MTVSITGIPEAPLSTWRHPVPTSSPIIWPGGNFYSGRDPSSVLFVFGINGRPHLGVDYKADAGEPIYAPAAGRVVAAKDSGYNNGAGIFAKLVHNVNGAAVFSYHLHMSRLEVTVGQVVAAGDVIGRVGTTGASSGDHLHTEIWHTIERPYRDGRDDVHLDPQAIYGPHPSPNKYRLAGGPKGMKSRVERLQTKANAVTPALAGVPLQIDGVLGPLTEAVLAAGLAQASGQAGDAGLPWGEYVAASGVRIRIDPVT